MLISTQISKELHTCHLSIQGEQASPFSPLSKSHPILKRCFCCCLFYLEAIYFLPQSWNLSVSKTHCAPFSSGSRASGLSEEVEHDSHLICELCCKLLVMCIPLVLLVLPINTPALPTWSQHLTERSSNTRMCWFPHP